MVQNKKDWVIAVWEAVSSLGVFLNSIQPGNCLVPPSPWQKNRGSFWGGSLEWGLTGMSEGLCIFLRGNKDQILTCQRGEQSISGKSSQSIPIHPTGSTYMLWDSHGWADNQGAPCIEGKALTWKIEKERNRKNWLGGNGIHSGRRKQNQKPCH